MKTRTEKAAKTRMQKQRAVKNALTALEVSYGYVHSHLIWLGRPTAGDSMLSQLSAAINGLGGKTPNMGSYTDGRTLRALLAANAD